MDELLVNRFCNGMERKLRIIQLCLQVTKKFLSVSQYSLIPEKGLEYPLAMLDAGRCLGHPARISDP